MGDISRRIGEQIKLYRKLNHMKLEEVAARISKSSATVSKYERGDIIIDVETLCQLAEIFHINPNQLLLCAQEPESAFSKQAKGIFRNTNRLYLYWGGNKKSYIGRGLLEIFPGEETDEVMCYACVDESFSKQSSIAVYRGRVEYTDIFSRVYLVNQANPIDYIHIHVTDDLSDSMFVYAMVASINTSAFEPVAFRMMVCKEKQVEDEAFFSRICVSKKELERLKKEGVFSLFSKRVL